MNTINFVWCIFGGLLYSTLLIVAVTAIAGYGQKLHGGVVWTLFALTFVIVGLDWYKFYTGSPVSIENAEHDPMGVPVPIPESDVQTPQDYLKCLFVSCWLLVNIACFYGMFLSAYRKDIFDWIACISIFNFNNVFWHLHYKTPIDSNTVTLLIREEILFLSLGILGIIAMGCYCFFCDCPRKKQKNTLSIFINGLRCLLKPKRYSTSGINSDDAGKKDAGKKGEICLLIFVLALYLCCTIFYNNYSVLPIEAIVGTFAALGIVATIVFFSFISSGIKR